MSSIYKKVSLLTVLAKSLRDYEKEPSKIISKVVNDHDLLQANADKGKSLIVGLENSMTHNHAKISGRQYMLDVVDINYKVLEKTIRDRLTNLQKVIKDIGVEIESADENYVKSNLDARMTYLATNPETTNYFIKRLERDFLTKLTNYNYGLTINIDMNKFFIIMRKALQVVKEVEQEKLESLNNNSTNMTKTILTLISKESGLEINEGLLSQALDQLKAVDDLQDLKLNNPYEKIGNIIKEIALQCPELETETLNVKTAAFDLKSFIRDSYNILKNNYNVIANLVNQYSNTAVTHLDENIKKIIDAHKAYAEMTMDEVEYEDTILRSILAIIKLVNIDQVIQKEAIEIINKYYNNVIIFIAIQNLYLDMSTYGLQEG